MPSRTAFILRLVRAIAAADVARMESDRVVLWFALRQTGVPAGWLERVVGREVRKLETRRARLDAHTEEPGRGDVHADEAA